MVPSFRNMFRRFNDRTVVSRPKLGLQIPGMALPVASNHRDLKLERSPRDVSISNQSAKSNTLRDSKSEPQVTASEQQPRLWIDYAQLELSPWMDHCIHVVVSKIAGTEVRDTDYYRLHVMGDSSNETASDQTIDQRMSLNSTVSKTSRYYLDMDCRSLHRICRPSLNQLTIGK